MRYLHGLAPAAVITWSLVEGQLVIEKSGQYGLGDVRSALKLSKGVHKT